MFHSLREFFSRPVAWGAVILSYVGIFLGFAFAIYSHDVAQSTIRSEARSARIAIVESGRIAIKSGCDYDNQRSKELRDILVRSLIASEARLHDPKMPADQRPELRKSIRLLRDDLSEISTRDCTAAANILTANPSEVK